MTRKSLPPKTKLIVYFVICAMCLAMFVFFFLSIFLEATYEEELEQETTVVEMW